MDDLDHSVLIAEKDWDCFYAESEECSIQQAQLAVLDDSGLSDADDEKTLTHVSSNVEQHKQCASEDCEIGQTPENSELTKNSNHKNESAGQICESRPNKQEATCECFGLDHNQTNEESSPTEQSYVVITNLSGNGESQGENESSQANIKSVSETSPVYKSDIKHENVTESTGTGVTDSLPVLRKEKERWFITVNYSPVQLREKVGTSGQKKRRKKKLSKNMSHGKCSSINNNTEEKKEIFERQTMQEKFKHPPQTDSSDLLSTTHLNNTHKENHLSDLHNFQDLQSSSSLEPTPDNLVHMEEESPRFILGSTTPILPSDSEGERTEQQELFGQSNNVKESTFPQETLSSTNTAKDPTLGPTRPIFAMSSFWDEMEKLTINDILELRTANTKRESNSDTCDAHVDQDLVDYKDDRLEDTGLIDDAADSDYFTHVDDCKPDRSSCEFSTLSDYDEEFLQVLHGSANPTPEPCESNEQMHRFLEPVDSFLQENPNEIWPSYQNESNEIVRRYRENDLPLCMYPDAKVQMQDMLLTSNVLLDHCDFMRSTPSPVLSMSDALDDQCLLSLCEILKNDKDSERFQTKPPNRHISIISFPFSQNLCVPETYDDFFSDFEVGNFLFPSVQTTSRCEKNIVPIYSSSRSVVKDLTFPEEEESVQSDSKDENMPIRVITRCASPYATQNLFFNTNQSNTWRNLSLRRIKFSFMGRTWCRMASSWVAPKTLPADMTVFKENWNRGTTLNSSIAHPNIPVLLQENQASGPLTEQQIYMGQAVSGSGRNRFCFSLKQADMCLVCIAFASWVLKSSNPQSTDMWKAALLANVSAISAIQYLRRCVKEVTEDEP